MTRYSGIANEFIKVSGNKVFSCILPASDAEYLTLVITCNIFQHFMVLSYGKNPQEKGVEWTGSVLINYAALKLYKNFGLYLFTSYRRNCGSSALLKGTD